MDVASPFKTACNDEWDGSIQLQDMANSMLELQVWRVSPGHTDQHSNCIKLTMRLRSGDFMRMAKKPDLHA